MAATMDFREKILKEGVLKHRQTSIALPRWKTRYVVFKISGGGRLQFIIYKETPTSPVNEVKEIAIEEFGGLESTTKMESEKNVFSVITTSVTDSFSTDSSEDLREWTSLLQEYLGKELTFSIVIPQKQGQLKSGRGVLRIRNTGFTITTCDNPPRCMGTWQIIHIRKFGGSEAFKFQTGSKCPSGELLYSIQTDDNAKVKALFNDLSQHKPIFSDDRVGRRMTLEQSHTHGAHRLSPSRFSLTGKERDGRDSPAPTYENKDVITEAAHRAQKRDCPPPLPPNRRLSSNDDRNTPFSQVHGMTQQRGQASIAPLSPLPMKCDDQRMYQNISRQPQGGPHSPTKHRGRYPVPPSEPVPDGYYNVSPPLALKKYPSHRTSSSSPPSLSQEEDAAFFSEFAPVPPPPIKTVSNSTSLQDGYMDSYFRLNPQQRPTMKLEGDNLVVHRLHNGGVEGEGKGRGAAVIPSKEEASMYQNLDFMSKKPPGTVTTTANVYLEDVDSGASSVVPGPAHLYSGASSVVPGPTSGPAPGPTHPMPIISDMDMEIHNYTNVDFALESAHRRPPLASLSSITGSPNKLARAGDVRRKVSAPPLSRDRSGAMSYTGQATPTADTSTPITSNLSLSLHPKLKPSLSSHDIQQAEKQQQLSRKSDPLPEYYNLFVPRLPAFQREEQQSPESQIRSTQATLSSFPAAVDSQSASGHRESSKEQEWKKEGVDTVDHSSSSSQENSQQENKKMARLMEDSAEEDEDNDEYDQVCMNPGASKLDVEGSQGRMPQTLYDHLELRSNSGTPRFSPVPSPSPENLSRSNTPRPPAYDQLALKEPSPGSEKPPQPLPSSERSSKQTEVSSQNESPEPPTSSPARLPLAYERKIEVVGHTHNYEYIEVALKGAAQGGSEVPGPSASTPPRHNSAPSKSDNVITQPTSFDNELPSEWLNSSGSRKLGNGHRDSFPHKSPNTHPRRKPLPLQSIPLDSSFSDDIGTKFQEVASARNGLKLDKPLPKPRKPMSSSSSELVSSGESDNGKSTSPQIPERSNSPSRKKTNNDALTTGPLPSPIHGSSKRDTRSRGSAESQPPSTQKKPKVPPKQSKQTSNDSTTPNNGLPSSAPATALDSNRNPSITRLHKSHLKSSQSFEESPALPPRPKDQSSFTVSLPATEFQFDKPLVPPRPRVLEHKTPGVQYATMTFTHAEDDSNYTQVYPTNSRVNIEGVPAATGSRDVDKVEYQSINFEVTEGLRKTREDVESQRSREIEWLQQRGQSLKVLTTADAK